MITTGPFQTTGKEKSRRKNNVTAHQPEQQCSQCAASESAIRDTDMAAEMVNFTKQQILTQAAQAMLTQANQSSQNILQMLR